MDFGDNHRRSITSTLCYTEERLGQIESVLTGQESQHILRRIEDDLSSLQKERISGCIHAIRSLIASLKGSLSLEVQTTSLSQVIGGVASTLWVTLVDTEPKRLTRYGSVPQEISTALGPALEAIMTHLREVQAIIAHR